MKPLAHLGGITFDCADPRSLAGFYRAITGWEVAYDSDGYMFLDTGADTRSDTAAGSKTSTGGTPNGQPASQRLGIGFQRVDGYQPPSWPGGGTPARGHMDFYVDDLDGAGRRLEALGATKAQTQPGGDRWRVYLDPAGHPFCIIVPGAFD